MVDEDSDNDDDNNEDCVVIDGDCIVVIDDAVVIIFGCLTLLFSGVVMSISWTSFFLCFKCLLVRGVVGLGGCDGVRLGTLEWASSAQEIVSVRCNSKHSAVRLG